MSETISLAHGEGGEQTHQLITKLFTRYFSNQSEAQFDGAVLRFPDLHTGEIVMTTDSFVVQPLFFPGGNIGKLAIAGTVNDLVVSGAIPAYLTAAFILEEGFPIDSLEQIVATMAEEANKAGVRIVAGDTKVVERGKADGVFINTTGIGVRPTEASQLSPERIEEGDVIIVTGTVGDHGTAILMERESFNIDHKTASDCASLNHMLLAALRESNGIRMMRDATRGGLATVLVEWAEDFGLTIELEEEKVPISGPVVGISQILGYDPLYLANEGKAVLLVSQQEAERVLEVLRSFEVGQNAAIVGQVQKKTGGQMLLCTPLGMHRRLSRLTGIQLPRIC
ncbi:hydrogenase expression/formation protein HypE [Brevibacillus sp. SYSU BS000544]|uniref:hydrogenase expression/formation protein HypE n=1 Tax=Brevibacillus sp. SYSU BS000544 TaxID=3416443 RepID=UPI003CE4486D